MQLPQERMMRVLLIYRKMIPSIRLCGHSQMQALAEAGRVEYRAVQELRLRRSDLEWADVVLLGRLDSRYEYRLVRALHDAGRCLVYILDDDLLSVVPELSSAEYYGQERIRRCIQGMLELSDAILSPSPRLLERYASGGKRAIRVEEPAIDPVPFRPHDPDEPVKLGFAGSIDRTGDLEALLGETLLEIKAEYGDRVQIEFFGAIPSFAGRLGARCIPYRNSYDEYRQTLNGLAWDIGLAPMPDTPFHACKHYNKFVEYAAAGTVGIFSDVEPYTRLKRLEQACVFCGNSPQAWHDAIKALIDQPQLRETMRSRVSELARTEFTVEHSALQLLGQIQALDRPHGGPVDRLTLPLGKLIYLADRGRRAAQKIRNTALKGMKGALKR